MNSEKVQNIIMQIAKLDINKVLNYEALIFNFYFYVIKKTNNFNDSELEIIKRAFKECSEANVKIESIARQRRVLTGITKGKKGILFDKANHKKALQTEKEFIKNLGY